LVLGLWGVGEISWDGGRPFFLLGGGVGEGMKGGVGFDLCVGMGKRRSEEQPSETQSHSENS
jgi:hypothetical protein